MNRLSASGVPRALACPASLVLPHHRYHTAFADQGTERHADMEAAIDVGDAADVLPAQVMALIQEGDQQTTEAAFAYDCATDTARELGHIARREYTLSPYEIGGTVDLLIRNLDRAIVVDKKGFQRVDAAAVNEQTLTYALMVARTYNYDEITVVIFYELGAPDVAVLSMIDLENHARRLKELQFTVVRAQKDPTTFLKTGKHCQYCEAYLSCPKQTAFGLELVSADNVLSVESRIPFEDDRDAANAFDLYERAKMLTDRMRAALYARAGEREVPLNDGRILGARLKKQNERLDGNVTWVVLRQKHGVHIADMAIERKATKKKLTEALKFAGGKSVAASERDVMEEIRKQGGVTQGEPRMVVEVYEPKKALTP